VNDHAVVLCLGGEQTTGHALLLPVACLAVGRAKLRAPDLLGMAAGVFVGGPAGGGFSPLDIALILSLENPYLAPYPASGVRIICQFRANRGEQLQDSSAHRKVLRCVLLF